MPLVTIGHKHYFFKMMNKLKWEVRQLILPVYSCTCVMTESWKTAVHPRKLDTKLHEETFNFHNIWKEELGIFQFRELLLNEAQRVDKYHLVYANPVVIKKQTRWNKWHMKTKHRWKKYDSTNIIQQIVK